MEKLPKITQTNGGQDIYIGMGYPEDLTGYDIEIVKNTLTYYDFIAQMSDDYNQTKAELRMTQKYRQEHNI